MGNEWIKIKNRNSTYVFKITMMSVESGCLMIYNSIGDAWNLNDERDVVEIAYNGVSDREEAIALLKLSFEL